MTSIGPKGCPRSRSIYTRVDVHAEWLTGGAGSAAEPEASEPEPALALVPVLVLPPQPMALKLQRSLCPP